MSCSTSRLARRRSIGLSSTTSTRGQVVVVRGLGFDFERTVGDVARSWTSTRGIQGRDQLIIEYGRAGRRGLDRPGKLLGDREKEHRREGASTSANRCLASSSCPALQRLQLLQRAMRCRSRKWLERSFEGVGRPLRQPGLSLRSIASRHPLELSGARSRKSREQLLQEQSGIATRLFQGIRPGRSRRGRGSARSRRGRPFLIIPAPPRARPPGRAWRDSRRTRPPGTAPSPFMAWAVRAMIGRGGRRLRSRSRIEARRFEAVHLGHLDVHEAPGRTPPPIDLDRLLCRCRPPSRRAPASEHRRDQPLVDRVVLGQQDPQRR